MHTWRVISASVTGASHLRNGQECQDFHICRVISSDNGEVLVAVVADGAGSAELSADGARIAACAATRTASRLLRLHTHPLYEGVLREILQEALLSARKELEGEAQQRERRLRDFATTLIVAICAPKITGAAQIGDGAAVTVGNRKTSDEDIGGYTLVSPPQRGEYVNTTNFITSSNWRSSSDISTRYGGVSRLAMFTDGIQSLALDTSTNNTPHTPFFNPLFYWADRQEDELTAANSLKEFLSSSKVTSRVDDDLTLLLAILS